MPTPRNQSSSVQVVVGSYFRKRRKEDILLIYDTTDLPLSARAEKLSIYQAKKALPKTEPFFSHCRPYFLDNRGL